MTEVELEGVRIRKGKLSEVQYDPHNANLGSERGDYMIEQSEQQFGWAGTSVADSTLTLIGGNKSTAKAGEIGLSEDAIFVHTQGDVPVIHVRDDLTLDDPADEAHRARRLAYMLNRSQKVSYQVDVEQLRRDLEQGVDLSDLWFPGEFTDLFGASFEQPQPAQPNPRHLGLDVIYTISSSPSCCLAVRSGLKWGINSSRTPDSLCGNRERYHHDIHRVWFVDNDYFHYDHTRHKTAVERLHPRYATVRDIMSPDQCREAGIEWYSVEQILDWAYDLQSSAEEVIVIPKYDCLDQIPSEFMLGYSIPTSHGGTPLPPELFLGRRIHLLGGSWKNQLAYLAVLGDDVVSLDNNHICLLAHIGDFILPDGTQQNLKDYGWGHLPNPYYVCQVLSFGAIVSKVNELYPPGRVDVSDVGEPDSDFSRT